MAGVLPSVIGRTGQATGKKVVREKVVVAALPELSLWIVGFALEHGPAKIGHAIKLTDEHVTL